MRGCGPRERVKSAVIRRGRGADWKGVDGGPLRERAAAGEAAPAAAAAPRAQPSPAWPCASAPALAACNACHARGAAHEGVLAASHVCRAGPRRSAWPPTRAMCDTRACPAHLGGARRCPRRHRCSTPGLRDAGPGRVARRTRGRGGQGSLDALGCTWVAWSQLPARHTRPPSLQHADWQPEGAEPSVRPRSSRTWAAVARVSRRVPRCPPLRCWGHTRAPARSQWQVNYASTPAMRPSRYITFTVGLGEAICNVPAAPEPYAEAEARTKPTG